MRLVLFIAIGFFGVKFVTAQSIIVDRQVIGSTGALTSSNGTDIASSVGESVIVTGQSTSFEVTQGFEQPLFRNIITAEIITVPESCRGAGDGAASISSISGCEGPYNVLWDNGSAGLTAVGYETGEYLVTIITDQCEAQISFFIGIESEVPCQLIFYSGITPNNDGDNDYWHIENIELPEFGNNEVRIFNRWGEEVWSAQGYDNDQVRWEGQGRNDRALPDGTYYYVAEVNASTFKGYIELTR